MAHYGRTTLCRHALVLVERKPTASLWALAEQEHLCIVEFASEQVIEEILTTQDSRELQQLAKRYLQIGAEAFIPDARFQGLSA